MSDDTRLDVEINAEVKGTSQTSALSAAIERLNDAMQELVPTAKSVASAGERVQKAHAGIASSSKNAASGVDSLSASYRRLNKEASASVGFTAPKVPGVASSIGNLSTPGSRQTNDINYRNELAGAQAKEAAVAASQRLNASLAAEARAVGYAEERQKAYRATLIAGVNAKLDQVQASREASQQMAMDAANQDKAIASYQNLQGSLFSTRFALTDVARGATVAGVAIAAGLALGTKAAIDYQSAFASIQRTGEISGTALRDLRDDFVDLAQTIPATFSELAEIGSLAGQLNVPAERIADFTRTTAQLSATTDVSVEAAATAFGRLDALLPDVQGNYDKLGSSIMYVGINSVATESQVISTTSQIAAAGAQAGFTADQVIGLAASYASLGIAPEAARGSTIRVFSEIQKAISTGSDSLEEFANFAGMSAEEFKAGWANDAGGTFQAILNGMQAMAEGGENVEQAIRNMGITGVRDVNALLRLSQNAEIVAQNFETAGKGFQDGTQLGDAFAITAETLASKLQTLANSAQAFFATLGETATGPLSALVDGLKEAVVFFTELAANPLAQGFAIAAGAIGLVTAGLLLMAGAFARVGSGAIAIAQIRQQIIAYRQDVAFATYATNGLTASQARLRSTAAATALSLTSVKGALISTGVGAVVVVALTALTAGYEALSNSMKTNQEIASERWGDASGLADALRRDTAAAKEGAEVYGEVRGAISSTSDVAKAWVSDLERATGGQVNLNGETTNTTSSIQDQTWAIGENTTAVLANNLANDEQLQKLYEQRELLSQKGVDLAGFTSALAQGDTDTARQIYADFQQYLLDLPLTLNMESTESIEAMQDALKQMETLIGTTEGQIANAATQTAIYNDVMGITAGAADAAGDSLDGMGDSATDAVDAMREIQNAVDGIFAVDNALADLGNNFQRLVQSIADGGAYFNAFSEQGRANLSNLQASMVSAIAAGQQVGISATESIAILFAELQRQGVDTAILMKQLAGAAASIPGLSVTGVQSQMNNLNGLSSAGKQLAFNLGNIQPAAVKASSGIKKTGSAAKEATKPVRTLVDYANDLASVFDRTFEIRFGKQDAMDAVTQAWLDMAEATEKNNQAIKDAQATLTSLYADKAVQEYFLSVANGYQDTLRAGVIRGNIADINKKITEEEKKLNDAKEANTKTTEGNTQAALDGREELSKLVQGYIDVAIEMGKAGASQDEINGYLQQSKKDFEAQGLAMGYSREDLKKYGVAFDDFKEVIKGVPRNITVKTSSNTKPAEQALAEYVAKVKQTKVSPTIGDPGNARARGAAHGEQYALGWVQGTAKNRRIVTVTNKGVPGGKTYQFVNGAGSAISPQFFSKGGVVGNGAFGAYDMYKRGTDTVPAMLTPGEGVVNLKGMSVLGEAGLNALNSGFSVNVAPPRASSSAKSGSMSNVTELSAYDRQLLIDIRNNIGVNIGGDALQGAVAAVNKSNNRRGG